MKRCISWAKKESMEKNRFLNGKKTCTILLHGYNDSKEKIDNNLALVGNANRSVKIDAWNTRLHSCNETHGLSRFFETMMEKMKAKTLLKQRIKYINT